jgi:drug/metabolite transporter (DMT)-like permease
MISLFVFSIFLVSTASYTAYITLLKSVKDKMSFVCLVITLANLYILLSFIIMQFYNGATSAQVIGNFNAIISENTIFYIIKSLLFFTQTSLLAYLLSKYPLSSVSLIIQLSVGVTAFGYYLLGDILHWNDIFGISIVCIGSLLAGFKKFTFPNVLKPLQDVPVQLYALGILRVLLYSINKSVLFAVTKSTAETRALHQALDRMPILHDLPSTFYTTIDYRVGLALFIIFGFFIFMALVFKTPPSKLYNYFIKHKSLIAVGSILYFLFIYLYVYAFELVHNKSIIIALSKFQIPFTLLGAAWFLKEEISWPKKIGAALIVGGGLLTAF